MTEMIVIKPDEFEDPDQRNYSISSYKGNLITFDKLVRFANLDSVPIEKTPEFSKLQENGKTIVLKLVSLCDKGIVYLEVTKKSITVGKESAIKWRHLQPFILKELPCIFENLPDNIQVEDRTGRNYEFGVLSEFIA